MDQVVPWCELCALIEPVQMGAFGSLADIGHGFGPLLAGRIDRSARLHDRFGVIADLLRSRLSCSSCAGRVFTSPNSPKLPAGYPRRMKVIAGTPLMLGQPIHHRSYRPKLASSLGLKRQAGIAPPVPAPFGVGRRSRRVYLRIQHDDAVAVGPSVVAEPSVNRIAPCEWSSVAPWK
jgi:hypothetical protein